MEEQMLNESTKAAALGLAGLWAANRVAMVNSSVSASDVPDIINQLSCRFAQHEPIT
jgi:hypothetical protein